MPKRGRDNPGKFREALQEHTRAEFSCSLRDTETLRISHYPEEKTLVHCLRVVNAFQHLKDREGDVYNARADGLRFVTNGITLLLRGMLVKRCAQMIGPLYLLVGSMITWINYCNAFSQYSCTCSSNSAGKVKSKW